MIISDTQNAYPELFGTYIIARVKYLLERVQEGDFVRSINAQRQLMHTLQYALQRSDSWTYTQTLLLTAAPLMEQAGYRDKWIPFLEQGVQQSQRLGNNATKAELQYQIGLLYRLQSKYTESYQWLRVSARCYAKVNHTIGQVKALNQLAYLAYLQHRYDEAKKLTHQAQNMLPQRHTLRAMSYYVQGMIDIDHGHWKEAEMWHRRALDIWRSRDDQRRMTWSLSDVAYTLRGQKKFLEAIGYYQEAATTLDSLGDIYHWSHAQMNLGITYFDYGWIECAVKCYQSARSVWQKQGDILNLAKLNTNLGIAYLSLELLSESEQAFQVSIYYYQKLNDHYGRLNASDGLAMALLAQKKYSKAIAVLKDAMADLPIISTLPAYDYLRQSMTNHLREASNQWQPHHTSR